MDEIRGDPSEINSLRVLNVLRTIKKRKMQADQSAQPNPKYKRATSDSPGPARRAISHDCLAAKDKGKDNDKSEAESVNDSNSFTNESDSCSTASMCMDVKIDPEVMKPVNIISDEEALMSLQEHLLEFGNQAEFLANEYGDESLDHFTDKELEEILSANGLNSNVYVLSSGRWSVNQEAQSGSRKPTIDQEFEQYFSMLML